MLPAKCVSILVADPRSRCQYRGLEGRAHPLHSQRAWKVSSLAANDLPISGAAAVGFFEAAAEATDCPDFGLRLASRQSFAILGPLWLMMRCARTVQDALEVLVEFFILHTSGAIVGLKRQPDGSAFVTYSLVAGLSTRDRQTIELGLALLCNELRIHCGPQWMPKGGMFCHDRLPGLDSHRRCFGRTVSFNREFNALWLDAACLCTPLVAGSYPGGNLGRHLIRAQHYRDLRVNAFSEWSRPVA